MIVYSTLEGKAVSLCSAGNVVAVEQRGQNKGAIPRCAALPPAAAVPRPGVRPAEYGPAPQLREAAGFQIAMPEADVVAVLVAGRRSESAPEVAVSEPSGWLDDSLGDVRMAYLLEN